MNPIKRIRQVEGLSLEQLSERVGINEQALYINECGCYNKILPKLLDYLVTHFGYTRTEIEKDYRVWVKQERQNNRHKFEFDPETLTMAPPSETHPFTVFRGTIGLSRQGFAKTFLVHPASLYTLEVGDSQSIPRQVKIAMIEMGFTRDFIGELEYRCREFSLNAA